MAWRAPFGLQAVVYPLFWSDVHMFRYMLFGFTGQISVNKSLGNLEIGSNHDVTIVAVDERGLRSQENALVVITVVDGDILEGGPFFSSTHYHFTIEENAPFASYVGSVEAVSSGMGI